MGALTMVHWTWTGIGHGDHVMVTKSRMGNAGGVIMLGRSDGVLYVLLPTSLVHTSLSNYRRRI